MRRILLGLLAVVLSLVLMAAAALAWATLTTSGARWAVGLAQNYVPGLSLRITGGTLLSGLDIEDLSWRQQGISVEAGTVGIRWTPSCLGLGRVCVDRVDIAKLRVDVSSSGGEGDSGGPPGRISLPLAIGISRAKVTDARIRVDGQETGWDRLETAASFAGHTLRLAGTRLAGLRVVLPKATGQDKGPVPDEPVKLPSVVLPVDLVADDFRLDGGRLDMAGEQYPVNRLSFSADLRGQHLRVRQLALEAPQGTLNLSGRATLSGDYPLQAELHAHVPAVLQGKPLDTTIRADGSVASLGLDVHLAEPVQADAKGTLQALMPQLPFQVALQSKRLQWPLAGQADVAVSDVALQVQGNRVGYGITGTAAVEGPQVPHFDLKLIGTGTPQRLHVTRLTGKGLDGTVEANGQAQWLPKLSWNAQARLDGVNPGAKWPQAQARVDARLQSDGSVDDAGLVLNAVIQQLNGRFRGYDLAARGHLTKQPGSDWTFKDVRLEAGPNRITGQGRYGERWSAQGEADCPKLAVLWPGLSGELKGSFSVSGAGGLPDIRVRAQAQALAFESVKADSVRLDARIKRLAREDSRLTLTAKGAAAGGQALGTVKVRLAGSLDEHHLDLSAKGAPYTAQVAVSGGFDSHMIWRGRLQSARLGAPVQHWTLAGRPVLQWSPPAQAMVVAPHCWVYRKANLCATEPWRLGAAGRVAVKLSGYELAWFQEWMPPGVVLQGGLAGHATADWKAGELPLVTGEVEARQGQIVLATAGPAREGVGYQPLQLPYDRVALDAKTEGRSVSLTLALDSSAMGKGRAGLKLSPTDKTYGLSGDVKLEGLELAVVSPFFPDLRRIAGHVSANGQFGGTLEQPRFDGQVKLADGEVAGRDLPMHIQDLTASVEIHGSQASLDGGFRSGEGKATLKGSADWGGEAWQAQASLKGERLAVAYQSIVDLKVSPDLTLRVEPQKANLSGRIEVPEGKITLKELPEQAVTVSDDVVIVNKQPEKGAGPQPLPKRWSVEAGVEVELGDNVTLKGYGVRGRLAGSIKVRQVVAGVPEAFGEIRIEDGRYEAYGEKLTIRAGRLIFAGPLTEPDLYVEAVRTVKNVTAGLRIQGSPENPNVTLFSDPAMSQQEILSYLILGHAPGEGGSLGQNALVTQAAVSLGILGGGGYASAVAKELGIQKFEVGTSGEGNDTQFVVSGYLSPNLYISYGVGLFTPVNTFTVHYDLTESIYLEAVSSLESALDIYYSFKY